MDVKYTPKTLNSCLGHKQNRSELKIIKKFGYAGERVQLRIIRRVLPWFSHISMYIFPLTCI